MASPSGGFAASGRWRPRRGRQSGSLPSDGRTVTGNTFPGQQRARPAGIESLRAVAVRDAGHAVHELVGPVRARMVPSGIAVTSMRAVSSRWSNPHLAT